MSREPADAVGEACHWTEKSKWQRNRRVCLPIFYSVQSSRSWCCGWWAGLRYDDLYDDLYDLDIKEAMHRLPSHVIDLRNQRLKRAMDMGIKHVYMDKEMQVSTVVICHLMMTMAIFKIIEGMESGSSAQSGDGSFKFVNSGRLWQSF